MSHLKLLNHPNIVKILGCYTYESNHNILFEFAAGGTLARFLEAPRPAIFEHGHTIMMAATGLASALHSLHEFSIDHLAWNAIGTHHDLKPSNILIEQNKFLLADFGLSTLKDASSSSQTRFKQVNQYYSAPECHERVTDDSRMVSRAADIWSLGCIFSELVAYLLGGVEGVNNFRGSRRLIRDNLIVSRFYASPTEEHPAVREWITATMSSSIRSMSLWCHLISDMLCMDPASRPKAGEVVSRIQFATLVCLFEYIQHYFARLLEKDTSVQALIEHERFVSWCHACGIVQDYQSDTLIPDRSCPWHTNGRPSYEAVLSLFVQISTVLETAHTYYADSPNSISKSIRQLNNLLFTGTANNLQGKASMYLKYQVLAKSDLRMLCDLANGTLQPTYHRDLGRIAVVKQMAKFLDERLGQTDPKLYISASDLGIHQELADSFAYTSSLVSLDDGVEHQILVEWKMYQAPQAESNTAAELLQRLENIAILLRKAYESTDLQILPCKGVFQDVGQYRCGLVYMFPEFASGEKAQAITLQQILSPDLRRKSQPPLEVRYHLAHSLATSLAKFHQLSWLQRSISSQNIVFFHPSGTSSWLDGTRTPYFIGYSNSRPDGGIPFTEGPSEDPILRNYMHPVYRANDRIRFRAEFDCFSLGLVLLEIGLWKSLTGIIEGNKRCRGSPDVVRLKLLELEVPLLRLTMGTKYASAVQACLSDSYLQVSEIKGLEVNRTKELWVQFEKTVLDPLALYLVG